MHAGLALRRCILSPENAETTKTRRHEAARSQPEAAAQVGRGAAIVASQGREPLVCGRNNTVSRGAAIVTIAAPQLSGCATSCTSGFRRWLVRLGVYTIRGVEVPAGHTFSGP